MKGTIIFDFDDTLFNTAKLKNDYFKLLASDQYPEEVIKGLYKVFSENVIERSNTAFEIFLKSQGVFVDPLIEENFAKLDLKSYVLFPVQEVILALSKEYDVILLTKGEAVFQKLKLEKSEIGPLFNKIYITQEPKENFLKDQTFISPVFFVNDKASENFSIKKIFPNFHIFLMTQYVSSPIPELCIEVTSLSDMQ